MKSIPLRLLKSVPQEPILAETFRIRDVSTILGGKDMSQEVHRHDFYFLLALRKGSGKHRIDFHSYPVSRHTIFLMRPGQVHQLTLNQRSEGYLIEFKTDLFTTKNKVITNVLRRATNTNHYLPEKKTFDKIFSLLNILFDEYNNALEEYDEAIKANLSLFLIELIRNQQRPLHSSYSYEQEQFEKLQELLEKNITTHKQVSHYASMLHLSVYQLNAITKATLGKTCSQVIDDYIILEAKRCLLSTTQQINQTAFYLGYDDVSYFIRFFKKHTGYSPENFRLKFK